MNGTRPPLLFGKSINSYHCSFYSITEQAFTIWRQLESWQNLSLLEQVITKTIFYMFFFGWCQLMLSFPEADLKGWKNEWSFENALLILPPFRIHVEFLSKQKRKYFLKNSRKFMFFYVFENTGGDSQRSGGFSKINIATDYGVVVLNTWEIM